MKKVNVVKLVVDKETDKELKELGIAIAKCWNEVNWLRMQQYKRGERIDFAKTEKGVYEKYKHVLKTSAQQVARKNSEAWRAFFTLSRKKKERELPKRLKLRPPGYWKTRSGYRLVILVRNDRYTVDESERARRTGRVINADLNGAINILHIPESPGTGSRGQLPVRDRGNGLKAQPVVYRWTNGAGWVLHAPTSNEVVRMKAVNHKPMNRPEGTPTLQGGEEVRRFEIASTSSSRAILTLHVM